jgi:predicted GIY-YIG superfamily endonuclease
MKDFHYVYILVSARDCSRHYTGLTQNLADRVQRHNRGGVPHTAKHRPWLLDTAVAFRSRKKAAAFEAYLKSGSGREFARRHF